MLGLMLLPCAIVDWVTHLELKVERRLHHVVRVVADGGRRGISDRVQRCRLFLRRHYVLGALGRIQTSVAL